LEEDFVVLLRCRDVLLEDIMPTFRCSIRFDAYFTDYREITASLLYPGSQTSLESLRPAVLTLERVLYIDPTRRRYTLLHLDG
jgi:hypothetical protein